jgi:hypothetical protein
MTRPKTVGIEMGNRIGRNFFDRSPDRHFTPGLMRKRTMTAGDDHAGGLP